MTCYHSAHLKALLYQSQLTRAIGYIVPMTHNSKDMSVNTKDRVSGLNKPDVNKNKDTSSSKEIVKASNIGKPELEQAAIVSKKEIGGPKGLEPTRYGDWESKGRCYDF